MGTCKCLARETMPCSGYTATPATPSVQYTQSKAMSPSKALRDASHSAARLPPHGAPKGVSPLSIFSSASTSADDFRGTAETKGVCASYPNSQKAAHSRDQGFRAEPWKREDI